MMTAMNMRKHNACPPLRTVCRNASVYAAVIAACLLVFLAASCSSTADGMSKVTDDGMIHPVEVPEGISLEKRGAAFSGFSSDEEYAMWMPLVDGQVYVSASIEGSGDRALTADYLASRNGIRSVLVLDSPADELQLDAFGYVDSSCIVNGIDLPSDTSDPSFRTSLADVLNSVAGMPKPLLISSRDGQKLRLVSSLLMSASGEPYDDVLGFWLRNASMEYDIADEMDRAAAEADAVDWILSFAGNGEPYRKSSLDQRASNRMITLGISQDNINQLKDIFSRE